VSLEGIIALSDGSAHFVVGDENAIGGNDAAGVVGAGEQSLGADGAQGGGEVLAAGGVEELGEGEQGLLGGWLVGLDEDHVTHGGGADDGGDVLGGAHFVDQQHVETLVEGGADAADEVGDVDAHLALLDQGFLGGEGDAERAVLDSADAASALLVELVDGAEHRGGFAGAG
jgi:hypothetical protein